MQKPALTTYPIHAVLRDRWSPRAFADASLDPATLCSLFEAARWSPSSGNEQPWRFIVATRDDANGFAALQSCLTPRNQRWAGRAAALVLLAARLNLERSGEPNRHALHDVGLALAGILFEATSRGVASHPMAGFDVATARQVTGLPDAFEPLTMLALGLPGDPEKLPEDLRTRELAPRTRRPLAELVHSPRWGQVPVFLTVEGDLRP